MAWAIGFFPIVGKETRRPHCARRRVSERNRLEAAALGAEMGSFAALSIKIPKGVAAFRRRNPKRKDILWDVLSFWWTIQDLNL